MAAVEGAGLSATIARGCSPWAAALEGAVGTWGARAGGSAAVAGPASREVTAADVRPGWACAFGASERTDGAGAGSSEAAGRVAGGAVGSARRRIGPPWPAGSVGDAAGGSMVTESTGGAFSAMTDVPRTASVAEPGVAAEGDSTATEDGGPAVVRRTDSLAETGAAAAGASAATEDDGASAVRRADSLAETGSGAERASAATEDGGSATVRRTDSPVEFGATREGERFSADEGIPEGTVGAICGAGAAVVLRFACAEGSSMVVPALGVAIARAAADGVSGVEEVTFAGRAPASSVRTGSSTMSVAVADAVDAPRGPGSDSGAGGGSATMRWIAARSVESRGEGAWAAAPGADAVADGLTSGLVSCGERLAGAGSDPDGTAETEPVAAVRAMAGLAAIVGDVDAAGGAVGD